MNIKITGQPIFWLTISLTAVEALRKLSKLHYDGKCKEAGEPGGFLWGWKNMVEGNGGGGLCDFWAIGFESEDL